MTTKQSTKTPTTKLEVEADIADARDELGATVQALAAKTDVKARAKETAGEMKYKLRDNRVRAGIAAAATLLTGLVMRKIRRRH